MHFQKLHNRRTRRLMVLAMAAVLALPAGATTTLETPQHLPEDVHHLLASEGHPLTMEEAAMLKDAKAGTPQAALKLLKVGNAQFFSGHTPVQEISANARRAQIMTQTPFAVILGCSDSRVPTEIVFHQALGDIFTVRVAGNIVEPATLGSIEYAVKHLKTKLLVVMGHEGCGAVSAAMLPEMDRKAEPANVQYLLDQVVPAVAGLPKIRDKKARMREAVVANVRRQVAQLKSNPVVVEGVAAGDLLVVGAFYEISSGAVDFLDTDEDLKVEPEADKAQTH